jgi:hypothetical protein
MNFKMSTIMLVSVALLGIGSLAGSYIAQSTSDYSLLSKRLTLVENEFHQDASAKEISLLKQKLDELEMQISSTKALTPLSQSEHSYNLSLASLEDRQSKLEVSLASLLNQQDWQIQSDSFKSDSAIIQADEHGQASVSTEQLTAGLNLLDQATLNGSLDKAGIDKLDKIAKELDRESSERIWERLFADIQDGKYTLPDEEPASNYYELPNGEVDGE